MTLTLENYQKLGPFKKQKENFRRNIAIIFTITLFVILLLFYLNYLEFRSDKTDKMIRKT